MSADNYKMDLDDFEGFKARFYKEERRAIEEGWALFPVFDKTYIQTIAHDLAMSLDGGKGERRAWDAMIALDAILQQWEIFVAGIKAEEVAETPQ